MTRVSEEFNGGVVIAISYTCAFPNLVPQNVCCKKVFCGTKTLTTAYLCCLFYLGPAFIFMHIKGSVNTKTAVDKEVVVFPLDEAEVVALRPSGGSGARCIVHLQKETALLEYSSSGQHMSVQNCMAASSLVEMFV